jgi:hypothetical protein
MRRLGAGLTFVLNKALAGRSLAAIALSAFLLLGVYLFRYALPVKPFSEELLIYDTIWLDAWSLGFVLVCAAIWLSPFSGRAKALLGVLALGVYGFVEIAVIFDGTPFSSYAYWGDQKFRQAIILKFMELGYPVDYYYKGLTVFYPPLLYLILAWLGKLVMLPAHAMLKTGGMLIYLLGPIALYWLWKPLTGRIRAWLVVLFTFLLSSCSYPYMLSAPHAFVAIAIFVPWWLRYVENIRGHESGMRHNLLGGLLGAVIVSTYYYPLFVGVFLLTVRLLWTLAGHRGIQLHGAFRWRRVLGVAVWSALFSCWYWAPIVWTALTTDFNASIAQWHHSESTSLEVAFTSLTWPGLLFLAGITFSLWRWCSPLHRALLMFPAITFVYVLVGSVLGAIDHPINLIKARDMMVVFGGPFVGLAAAALLRRFQRGRRQWIVPALTALALIVLCDKFSEYAGSGMVKTARQAYVPTWNTDAAEMRTRSASVFLCGEETFPSFYPVYTFLAANEHYSHPASRFKERYDFLALLETETDPRIVNIALRTNRYDVVDYFMPHREGAAFDVTVSLSNYPNKYFTRIFKFPETLVADTALFRRCKGDDLYEILEPSDLTSPKAHYVQPSAPDTLVPLMHLRMIRERLSEAGQVELDVYTGVDWSNWRSLSVIGKTTVFGDSAELRDVSIVADGDSLHLMMAFKALDVLSRRFRVSVHLFVDELMSNYDFDPQTASNTWGRYETVICRRTIPRPSDSVRICVGLFDRSGKLPGTWWAELDTPNPAL